MSTKAFGFGSPLEVDIVPDSDGEVGICMAPQHYGWLTRDDAAALILHLQTVFGLGKNSDEH